MAKQKKYRGSNRREMLCISVVVVILLGVMLTQSSQLREKNAVYAEKIDMLEAQIESESKRAEDIEQLRQDVKSEEYAGEMAKERLGMAAEDEILFRIEN